jgi:predicted RNase H-like HicB family nuclease
VSETPSVRRFLVVVEKTGRNRSAYLPDLPGCVATGDTPDETLARMRIAIDMHLRGLREDHLPIPEPSATAEYLEVALHE